MQSDGLNKFTQIPNKWRQPIRFVIVGGLATALHYGHYLLF